MEAALSDEIDKLTCLVKQMITACFLPLPLKVLVVVRLWGFVYRVCEW